MNCKHHVMERLGIMLKKLEFSNSYSFKDHVIFDLSTDMTFNNDNAAPRDSDIPEVVRYVGGRRGILPVAAVYGKNASGKTKLLRTLYDVILDALGDSFITAKSVISTSPYEQIIDKRKFYFVDEPMNSIYYSICVVMKDPSSNNNERKGWEYYLEYTIGENGVEAEKMVRRGLGVSDPDEVLYSRDPEFDEGPDSIINSFLPILRDREEKRLWFSQIAPAQKSGLSPLYEWFRYMRDGISFNDTDKRNQSETFKDIAKRIATDGEHDFKNKLLWLLQGLDSSIEEIEGHYAGPDNSQDKDLYKLYIYHKQENSSIIGAHDIQEESAGTRQIIMLFPLIYRSISEGLPFVCDELDKMVHPIVFKRIVEWYNSSFDSQNDTAQLIFTAHDTIALDSDCLRRDEVHIIDKNEYSISGIRRLSDIAPDSYPNMGMEFRLGIYGSSPSSFPYDFRRAGE